MVSGKLGNKQAANVPGEHGERLLKQADIARGKRGKLLSTRLPRSRGSAYKKSERYLGHVH